MLSMVNYTLPYTLDKTGEKYLSWKREEKIDSEKMGGRRTENLYLTLSSDRGNKLKMGYLGFVVSRKLSVLYFSILVLGKVWNRIYEQGCDDSSVILQTNYLLCSDELSFYRFLLSYFSSHCETEIVVSTCLT